MSRTFHHGERRIRVQGVRKDPPDLRRLARALIELAVLQAEADAEAEHHKKKRKSNSQREKPEVPPTTDTDRGNAA